LSKRFFAILLVGVAILPLSTFLKNILRQTATPVRTNYAMSWRSSGSTNSELVNNLFRNGLITEDRVKKAMMEVRILAPKFCI
jgi:hypothetical protein